MPSLTDTLPSDLRDLLLALGMGDHARPQSPHEVFQEALGVLRKRLSDHEQCRADWKATEQAATYQIAGLAGTLRQALRKLHPRITDDDLRRMIIQAAEAGRPPNPPRV